MKFIWNEIDNKVSDNYDLLICSVSYEERCLSFVKHYSTSKLSNVIVCHTMEYMREISDNLNSIKNLLTTISHEFVELYHKDSIASTDKLVKCLDKVISEQRVQKVVIDITTFTHEMTLILLWLFKEKYREIDVTFTYSNAKDYDPKNENNKWLSKGIDEIRSVLGYPGNLLPAKSTHLVIVVGYEYDRALSIISEMEPSSLSLAFGKSDCTTTPNNKHYGAEEHFKEIARDSLAFLPEKKIYKFDISCNDPEKAKREIQEHLDKQKESIDGKNIVIFAMNNKISTLGVGLLALEHKNIQLCYAPALIYNYKNYSLPGDDCYLFGQLLERVHTN